MAITPRQRRPTRDRRDDLLAAIREVYPLEKERLGALAIEVERSGAA